MDAPSIPIFVAESPTGESVRSILVAVAARASDGIERATIDLTPTPTPASAPPLRMRGGAKPTDASSGSTIAFFVAIMLVVAGASIAALTYAGPRAAERRPGPTTSEASTFNPPTLSTTGHDLTPPSLIPPVLLPATTAAPPAVAANGRAHGRGARGVGKHAGTGVARTSIPGNPY